MVVLNNIEEQDVKDLTDELVHELSISGLLMRDHEAILAYETIYTYLKNKYDKETKE